MAERRFRTTLRHWQQQRRGLYDAVSLLLYLAIVYGASLWVHPMGRDYGTLAEPETAGVLAAIIAMEAALFGDAVVPYHLVNLALLYACAINVYWIFRTLHPRAPIWLATWAATVFLATPVHSEAVLNVTGIVDLIPALLALWGILAYGLWRATGARAALMAATTTVGFSVVLFPSLVALPVALLVYELVAPGNARQRVAVAIGAAVAVAAGLLTHPELLARDSLFPSRMFGPLYFILYPIGFLPETARFFHGVLPPSLRFDVLVTGVVMAIVAVVVFLIHRKVCHPVFLFGVLGAMAMRLFQGDAAIDPVHLIGGGQLLVSSALIYMALSTVFGRIMEHPKWRTIMVSGTTLLALLMFILGIQNVLEWRHAGRVVAAFQRDAGAAFTAERERIGLLPDFQAYNGAPMMLSESIAYNTPFSADVPHVSLFKLHYDLPERLDVSAMAIAPDTIRAVIEHDDIRGLFPWPYVEPEAGREGFDVSFTFENDHAAIVAIRFLDMPMPPATLPVETRPSPLESP